MSNFSRHLVLLDGVTYVTSEHAWGWGADRKGLNMLGKLWMEIRTELQSKS